MMRRSKVLIVNPLLCTGCLECELVCSICKTGKGKSRWFQNQNC